jgi:7-carboxy-7-deazaguanine synthase
MKTVDEIVEEVRTQAEPRKIRDVILSGGEPLMQDTTLLLRKLVGLGYDVTIETSGSVLHTAFVRAQDADKTWFLQMSQQQRINISCSPKLTSSTPNSVEFPKEAELHSRVRFNADVLEWLQGLFRYSMYFKIVVTDLEADMKELQEQWIEPGVIKPWIPIYLMPEGKTREEIEKKRKIILEYARDNGYRFSPRLHIDVYGSLRGV